MAVAADFHRNFLIPGHKFAPDNDALCTDDLRLFFCRGNYNTYFSQFQQKKDAAKKRDIEKD